MEASFTSVERRLKLPQIVVRATDEDPQVRETWDTRLTLDNALWVQSIIVQRHLKDLRKNGEFHTQDKGVLWSALGMGVSDGKPEDCPWDASTRAMRFASVIGDQLWGMYALQQQQVRSLLTYP